VIPDEHLFRRESGRLVAALTRIFGIHNLPLAEDVVQDAFCRAIEVWKVRGVPDNPGAWLMAVAKHRALDVVRRERSARAFAADTTGALASEWTLVPAIEEAFTLSTIRDEQLRMMFSCCHPRLHEEVQVALVLNILCGFGAAEIASAFLTTRAAMEKRLARGKKVLAGAHRLFDLADMEFGARLSAVRRALYLLFNEGYHGSSDEGAVRGELCHEAIYLATLLMESPLTSSPETCALAALMCLQAARLPTRVDSHGDLSPLLHQDRSRWDAELIERGLALLDRSATGDRVTAFHVEAAIAAAHATAPTLAETNWEQIVGLYDRLVAIAPSPVVSLNRAIAVAERDGPAVGLALLQGIVDRDRLHRYPFYAAALGDMALRCGHRDAALQHFRSAAGVARSGAERRFLERRIQECESDWLLKNATNRPAVRRPPSGRGALRLAPRRRRARH
jgi:RNA polymerase sigma factor (sigma-70 family)